MAERRSDKDRPDGRSLRREANRQRIIDALIELVREGNVGPSAEEVSNRAGVGIRTVFRQFNDMDALYRHTTDMLRTELEPLFVEPLKGETFEARLADHVDRRALVFDRILPFRNFADAHRHTSRFLQDDYNKLRVVQRMAAEALLKDKVSTRSWAFDAIELLLSFDAWRHLRQDQALPFKRAKQTVMESIHAVLAARA